MENLERQSAMGPELCPGISWPLSVWCNFMYPAPVFRVCFLLGEGCSCLPKHFCFLYQTTSSLCGSGIWGELWAGVCTWLPDNNMLLEVTGHRGKAMTIGYNSHICHLAQLKPCFFPTLQQKKSYLERSVKEAEDNIREMLMARRAQ